MEQWICVAFRIIRIALRVCFILNDTAFIWDARSSITILTVFSLLKQILSVCSDLVKDKYSAEHKKHLQTCRIIAFWKVNTVHMV
jgi:hypothetical protein